MRHILIFLLFLVLPLGYSVSEEEQAIPFLPVNGPELFVEMELAGRIDFTGFCQAVEGYNRLGQKGKPLLTVVDFTKSSSVERFFVFDLRDRRILFTSLVAHGKNSGDEYAKYFSNASGSHKSSLGFYLTENAYTGRCGYSLTLNGLEAGINDRARSRGVVIHGADYCDPRFIETAGRLGRSFGCPAIQESINEAVIDAIKGGTLLYIYANDKTYLSQSKFLRSSPVGSNAMASL